MATRRSEFGYGSGRRRTASITENNAVLAPIPSPIARTATAVNPAFFRNMRIPKRMSFQRVSMQVLRRNILCGCEQRSLKAFAKHRIIQEHAHVERRRVPARFRGPVERWCCARWVGAGCRSRNILCLAFVGTLIGSRQEKPKKQEHKQPKSKQKILRLRSLHPKNQLQVFGDPASPALEKRAGTLLRSGC